MKLEKEIQALRRMVASGFLFVALIIQVVVTGNSHLPDLVWFLALIMAFISGLSMVSYGGFDQG
jgi:hypothetical protein